MLTENERWADNRGREAALHKQQRLSPARIYVAVTRSLKLDHGLVGGHHLAGSHKYPLNLTGMVR